MTLSLAPLSLSDSVEKGTKGPGTISFINTHQAEGPGRYGTKELDELSAF